MEFLKKHVEMSSINKLHIFRKKKHNTKLMKKQMENVKKKDT